MWKALTIVCVASLCGGAAVAQGTGRTQLFKEQLSVLDDRAARQYSNSVRLQPPKVQVPGAPGSAPAYAGRYAGPYLALARAAARRHGVPEDLFARLVQQESAWNPRAVSPKGAIGLAQLMPQTARLLRVDPHDPAQNLDGGARYLAMQYRAFGNWPHALAAYNAGPDRVREYDGVPPFAETRGYIARIHSIRSRLSGQPIEQPVIRVSTRNETRVPVVIDLN